MFEILYQHRQKPISVFSFGLMWAFLLAAFVIVYFSVGMHFSLWITLGFISRKIQRDRITSVGKVRNSWWYGFGIRLTPHGWMWNVSGFDAVELTYQNGKKFRIGTDDVDRLQEILRSE